jgi:hypothetical protein
MENINSLISSLKIKSLFYNNSYSLGYKTEKYYTSLRNLYIDIYTMNCLRGKSVYGTDTWDVTIHFLNSLLYIIDEAEKASIDLESNVFYKEIINELMPNNLCIKVYCDELQNKIHWKRRKAIELYKNLNDKRVINDVNNNNNIYSLDQLIANEEFITLDTLIKYYNNKQYDITFYQRANDLYYDIRKVLYKSLKGEHVKNYMWHIASELFRKIINENKFRNEDIQFLQIIELYMRSFDGCSYDYLSYLYHYDDRAIHLIKMEHKINTNK